MIYWMLAIGFILLRWLWALGAPMEITSFKGLFYLRDFFTLLPAFFFFYKGLLRPSTTLKSTSVYPYLFILFLLCLVIQVFIFQGPQIRDEACYLFQAKSFAQLNLWAPAPQKAVESFVFPYTVVEDQKWFGIFFPGTSLVFVPGVWLDLTFLINPLLIALLAGLTYKIAGYFFNRKIAFYTLILMLISPFVLQQGGSYLGHVSAALLFVTAAFLLLRSNAENTKSITAAALITGMLLLFRPLSAAVLIVFCLYLLFGFIKAGSQRKRVLKLWLLFCLAVLPGAILLFIYNALLTGQGWLTPHQLYFQEAPLQLGWHMITNSALNLLALSFDLFGVPILSLFPLLYLLLKPRLRIVNRILGLSLIHVSAYSLYTYHGISYGPRFYFEVIPFLIMLCSYGLYTYFSRNNRHGSSNRLLNNIMVIIAILTFAGYLPPRLWLYYQRGEYYSLPDLCEIDKPAIVVIQAEEKKRVTPFLAGFKNNDIYLQNDILFAKDLGKKNDFLFQAFPYRHHFYYHLSHRTLSRFK